MAVTLNSGEVVNQCDANTGFNLGSANTDIFAEPTASIGSKTSQTTNDYYTTSLGATAPYNYASGGGEFGQHIIIWLNVLGTPSPIDGGRIVVGDGTSLGAWYVPFPTGYTGGFQPRVINTAANFDQIISGSWTTTGNPTQLSNITQMGGGLNVTSKVSGNFSNVGVDQFTTGTGLRVDAGTSGTPNTFETLRAADEGSAIWGWMTSSLGSYVSRGGIYIGPSTGTATSVFSDSGQVVVFAGERVATGFYVISVRGSGTDLSIVNCVIRAEDTSKARWSFSVDGTSIPSVDISGGLWSGYNTITLQSSSVLSSLTLDDGNSIVQNGGTISGCVVQNSNTTTGTALITCDDPSNIENTEFFFSAGHALEFTTATAGNSYTFSGNTFDVNFGANGSTDAAIYNNSGGAVTLNISGGTTPTVRNGTGASTTIVNSINITLTGMRDNTEVRVYEAGTTTVVDGIEDVVDGTTDNRSFTFSDEAGDHVDIIVHNLNYKWLKISDFTIPSTNTSIPIQQQIDRNYSN